MPSTEQDAALSAVRGLYLELPEKWKRAIIAYVRQHDEAAFKSWIRRFNQRSRVKGLSIEKLVARDGTYTHVLDEVLFEGERNLPIRVLKCFFAHRAYRPNLLFLERMEVLGNTMDCSDPAVVQQVLDEIGATADELFPLYRAALALVEPRLFIYGVKQRTDAEQSRSNGLGLATTETTNASSAEAGTGPASSSLSSRAEDGRAPVPPCDSSPPAFPGRAPSWEQIERYTHDLARAHSTLRECAGEYEGVVQNLKHGFESSDLVSVQRETARLSQLFARKQEAEMAVRSACEVLASELPSVMTAVSVEAARSETEVLVARLSGAIDAARTSNDAAITTTLREAASAIRVRLRGMRAQRLSREIDQVRSLAKALQARVVDAAETFAFLDDGSYLDLPERDAKLRLENEASLLNARIKQADSERDQRRIEEVEKRFAAAQPVSLSELWQLATATTTFASDRLRQLARDVLTRGDYECEPDRVRSWCGIVGALTQGETPIRLEDVLPGVPPLPGASGQPAEELARNVLAAGNVDPSSPESWQLVEVLWRADRRDWAEALASAAWHDSGSVRHLAAWLLRTGKCPTAAQLAALLKEQQGVAALAVEAWARARGLALEEIDDEPLITSWLVQSNSPPAIHYAEAALGNRAESNPIAAGCCCAIAVATGAEGSIRPAWLSALRAGGFPRLAVLFAAYQRLGRVELCARLHQANDAYRAARTLADLTQDRNPKGGPAYEVWKRHIEPELTRIRVALSRSDTREYALSELEALDPEHMIRDALKEMGTLGLNNKARRTLLAWIGAYREHLPAATGSADVPSELCDRPTVDAVQAERARIAAANDLGAYVSALIEWAVHPLETAPVRPVDADYQATRRTAFSVAISQRVEPLLLWRFTLCGDERWLPAAGEDLVERAAGLGSAVTACRAYIAHRRLGLADALIARAPAEEREEVAATIGPVVAEARRDQGALVETFITNPLEAAGRTRAARDPAVSEELQRLRESARDLVESAPSEDLDVLERRTVAIADEVAALTEMCEQVDRDERRDIAARLRVAADAIQSGSTVIQPHLVAQLVLFAARGMFEPAVQLSRRALTDADIPEPGGAEGAVTLSPFTKPTPLRPAAAVSISQLSVVTRSIWDTTRVPPEFAPLASVDTSASESRLDRRTQLLLTARALYSGDDPRWRVFLGGWAIEQTRRRADEKAHAHAMESARDAVMLLASSDAADGTLLDEAIALWLATRIEASHFSVASPTMTWASGKRAAGFAVIAQLVRRFFELRIIDLLAECLCDAAEIGGPVLPRVLTTLSTTDLHLRGLLAREVLRGAFGSRQGALHVLASLIEPWLGTDGTAELRAVLTPLLRDDATRGEASAACTFLRDRGVPDALIQRFDEGLATRTAAGPDPAADVQRLTARIVTTSVYASAAESDDGGEIVAEISYREGAAPLRNLRAALTLEHSSISIDPLDRIKDVGHLRPGTANEISYRFVVAPNSVPQPKAKATLLVYGGNSDAPLIQRTFNINVGKDYPHRFAMSPYMYGKCLTKLDLIKGREKETREILSKLSGAHGDNFVVIYGMRRIGKSSLLQKLSLDERARRRYAAVHLDLEHLLKTDDTPRTFLEKVMDAIRDGVPDRRAKEIDTPVRVTDTGLYSAFEKYLTAVAEALGPERRLLLLFDEFQMLFESAKASRMQDVIKSLRHWIQYLPVAFVAAGTPELEEATVGPEQRLFQLGVPVRVGPLDELAARELVRDPAKDLFTVTPRAIDEIVKSCRRLPNLVQALCITLFNNVKTAEKTVATYRDAEKAIDEVARVSEYFTFLLAPIERNAKAKLLVRALADITLDERRGTPEAIREHLRTNGHGEDFHEDELAAGLDELARLGLVYNYKGEFSLQPPLLARHVRYRVEYAL